MQDTYKKVGDYYYKPQSQPLGKSTCATVYSAYDKAQGGRQVAMKVIPSTKVLQHQQYYQNFVKEVKVLRQIKDENIVQLLDVKKSETNLYIITEFCNGGDLDSYLKKNGAMEEQKALEIMYQICKAFNALNNLDTKSSSDAPVSSIIHKDIRTAHIFLHNSKVKIANFGFAKRVGHTFLGNPLYTAPQIFKGKDYNAKSDIWSSGIVVYECLFDKLPWTDTSIPSLYKNIHTKPLEFPKSIALETKDLIERMLEKDETKRISWEEIRVHPSMSAIGNLYDPANIASPLISGDHHVYQISGSSE